MTENERIRQVRKAKGLTMEEFGVRIGITKSSVSTMESGKSNPSDQTRRSICREFGVNEEWLRNGTEPMLFDADRDTEIDHFIQQALQGESDNFKRRLISALSRLNESDWLVLEKLISKMVSDTSGATTKQADKTKKASPYGSAAKIDIEAEVASYRADLERQEKVEEKLSAFDGFSANNYGKMA